MPLALPHRPFREPGAPRRVEEAHIATGEGGRSPDAAVAEPQETHMNSIIYLVGLVVVVLAILSFVGLA